MARRIHCDKPGCERWTTTHPKESGSYEDYEKWDEPDEPNWLTWPGDWCPDHAPSDLEWSHSPESPRPIGFYSV